MSLPPTTKPNQASIRSFFQSKSPQYAPPPAAAAAAAAQSKPLGQAAPPPPPPPAATAPPPTGAGASVDTATPPLPADLPREASIRPIAAADTNPLRRINALLLPVPYQDDFYRQAAEPGAPSRVITWAHNGEQPKVVGGVVCRVEPKQPGSREQTLYIRSLCLLSPYRSLGLINAALENIIASVVAQDLGVTTVSAHVWTENEEGLQWYDSREFSREGQPINGYYRKLRPDSAWLVTRSVPSSNSVLKSATSNGTSAVASELPPSATAAVVNLPPMGVAPPTDKRPPPSPMPNGTGTSFQNQRPDMEWNDLPADMAPGLLGPPKKVGSEPVSGASSRSSSMARKKRDRSYPAAAFGK